MKYYDVILIDKNGQEHFYMAYNLLRVKELIEFAIEMQQTIKSIKGRKR